MNGAGNETDSRYIRIKTFYGKTRRLNKSAVWHGFKEMVSQLTSPQQEPVTACMCGPCRYADLCGLVMALMALLIIKVVMVKGRGIFYIATLTNQG